MPSLEGWVNKKIKTSSRYSYYSFILFINIHYLYTRNMLINFCFSFLTDVSYYYYYYSFLLRHAFWKLTFTVTDARRRWRNYSRRLTVSIFIYIHFALFISTLKLDSLSIRIWDLILLRAPQFSYFCLPFNLNVRSLHGQHRFRSREGDCFR